MSSQMEWIRPGQQFFNAPNPVPIYSTQSAFKAPVQLKPGIHEFNWRPFRWLSMQEIAGETIMYASLQGVSQAPEI